MNQLLRHTVATVAYRSERALDGVSPEFAEFRLDPTSRTPAEILAHVGDLFDWALSVAEGCEKWRPSEPLAWDREVARFFAALAAFDARLAEAAPLGAPAERLFQGPIADALTHIGQLAMLRRVAGYRVRGENFFVAAIETGKVGPQQALPVQEF
jgi:hypothetical protein